MAYSIIEEEFEYQCHSIHPDIDPNIFLKEYNNYEQCIPLLRDLFTALHQYVHSQLPNIDLSFTARLKAKKSFLDKKILKISENISAIFLEDLEDKDVQSSEKIKKQETAIDTYLSFLLSEKFEKIKHQILTFTASGIDTVQSFSIIFGSLTDKEKNTFIKAISRTADTFAYSFIVKNVNYPIASIKTLDDGSIGIVEKKDNPDEQEIIHKIQPSIKFNPETDIVEKSQYIKCVSVNGNEYPLNTEYLVYPKTVSTSQRKLENALKNSDGKVTLLQDAILLQNGDVLPVETITYDEALDSYFLTTLQGERVNLTSRLEKEQLTLKKYDEETCEEAIKKAIRPAIKFFEQENDFRIIKEKDYIKNPKIDEQTGTETYKALHACLMNFTYNYKMEGQMRTFLAHLLYDNDHDDHKQNKVNNQKQNPILAKIYDANPLALDSSTSNLMRLLEDNPDIDIMDLMGTYFFTTTFSNNTSYTYLLEPEMAFMHIFAKHAKAHSDSLPEGIPHLDFSSYSNFIASKAKLKGKREFSDFDNTLEI